MKKSFLILALVTLSLAIAACALSESFPELTQQDPMYIPTETPASPAFDLPEGYDPASEEDGDQYSYDVSGVYDDLGRSMYAGATPIPLDPIDMPTATPKPTLTFTYGPVTADKLRLTFEAPAGWYVDTSAEDSITLTDPNTIDGYNAQMTIRLYAVANTFKLNDLRTELRNTLKALGQYNFSKWTTTNLANRTLLNKDGFYANYQGTYYDGTQIHGRVMMALLDNNQVIMVNISCAEGFFDSSYKPVVNHLRETLKQQ